MKNHQLTLKFLFIITGSMEIESLNEIFDTLWTMSLLNSNVLIQDAPNNWSIYTSLPYQNGCLTSFHFKIETFTPSNSTKNMTISIADLYPNKLSNFNKCPLNIAASIVDPFVTLQRNSNGKPKFRGIDIDVVNQIAENLNFLAIYKRSLDGTGHGYIFSNGTITGNMGLVR